MDRHSSFVIPHMPRELHLDGSEISVVKALGLTGGEIDGETLMTRASEMAVAELIDTVRGLIDMGYVVCDQSRLQTGDDFKTAHFHVNSGYAKDLREAMDPRHEKPKSRRVRRE